MENTVLRSTALHSLSIGNNCLIGPNAHIVGCTIEDEVFVATGAAVFHSAHLGKGCEVRIHAVVHLLTHVAAGVTVPIGWVAVGNPARILPPSEHNKIWEVQQPLELPAHRVRLRALRSRHGEDHAPAVAVVRLACGR